ncbi:MAG TPA: GspH/FimT family pseudopilin [Steroidobacteraceae bacterium]|nr:GspH/FimT family pseudopilin [Steroidobacteraceae bacterium]
METRQGSRGVTLIELCFALAIVAILAGLAAPGMRGALRTAAIRSTTLDLLGGLQQARTRSIIESRPGVFCLSTATGECIDGPARAWTAFLDGRGAASTLAGGALPRGIELRATRARLTFWPDSLAASTGTLTICDTSGEARPRAIVLSQSGRVRVADASPEACRA